MGIQQLSAADATSFALTARNPGGSCVTNKVHESATEFEALLVGQVLDKLEHTFAPSDDQSADPARDTVSSLGMHAVAQLLAQRHTFGIADMLQRALVTEGAADSTKASAKQAP